MIPRDYITEWRAEARWTSDLQVEQDLVISRALVELFSHPVIGQSLAFRGGTALYKLHFRPAVRYSEDIDLVQTVPEGIGRTLDAIHDVLDPWLGRPQWKQSPGAVTLTYRFASEDSPPVRMRLKVEINAREHVSVYGLKTSPFEVASRWFSGAAELRTFELDELLGTKLRALYQRKKGRDLFDLGLALEGDRASPERVVACFQKYMRAEGAHVSRAMFEQNLLRKKDDRVFHADISPLLAEGHRWSFDDAFSTVFRELIGRLPGDPWKGPP